MRLRLAEPSHMIALGLAAVAAATALPYAARAETLADAIALAYSTNPSLQVQRAQLRAVNETYVQARASAGMQVTAQADFASENLENTASGATFDGRSVTTTVGVTQPLFTGGRLAAQIEAAEADVLEARERLRQAETDLMQRVINAYAAVRRDQQTVQAARAGMSVLQSQLDETQAKVEVRENTRTDLAQAQSRLANSRSALAAYEAQLAISRAQYLNAVGQNPGELDPEPDLPGLPATVDAAFDAAETNNPNLLAAKRGEQGTRARVSQARAAFLPSVNLRVQAARAPSMRFAPDPYLQSFTAQAVVTQPLFTSGLNASAVRRALELNNADRLDIDVTRRNVVQALAQQWSQLVSARIAIVADQTNVEAAEAAFFGMREEERFGLRTTIELLNAQQELTQAQISLLRNRYTEFVSRAGVLNLMGSLSAGALVPGIETYEPATDFDRVKNRWALPTERVVRTLDALVVPDLGEPLKARETTTPDQLAPLPTSPSDALLRAPLRSIADIMAETQPGPGAN